MTLLLKSKSDANFKNSAYPSASFIVFAPRVARMGDLPETVSEPAS